jgi:hypothetical protein
VHAHTGRPLRAVARDPFDLTLWLYGLLAQGEADDRRAERIDLAGLVRLAVLDGDAFKQEAGRFEAERRPPTVQPNAYPVGAAAPSQADILAYYDHAIRTRRWVDAGGNPVTVT